MNQQKLDQHIDALLRAAGSALRHYTMQKSLDDMRAAMKAAVEELAKDDSNRLDFLESNQLETDSAGAWNEEPAFGVHRVSGGRNDRNWHCLGRGETLRAAIDAAMQPSKGADSSPENDIESAEAANSEKLREALKEIRSRLVENPMYAALTEDEELEIGGETAELSYLVRVADAAIEPTKGRD